MEFVDYYEVLGVSKDAKMSDIRRAHRKRALKLHPDRNPDASLDEWHRLTKAIEILGDETTRAEFDKERAAKMAEKERREAESTERRRLREELEAREAAVRDASASSVVATTEEERAHLERLRAQLDEQREELARSRSSSKPLRKSSHTPYHGMADTSLRGLPLPLEVLLRPERLPESSFHAMETTILNLVEEEL